MSLMDCTSNKAKKIIGKLDICVSLQKISGIKCPIFSDDMESLDTKNITELIKMVSTQLILLSVSDDENLEVIKIDRQNK